MSAARGIYPRSSSFVLVASMLIVGFAGCQPAARADEADRLEMWEEPSHQLVYVDGPARVLDIRIAQGRSGEELQTNSARTGGEQYGAEGDKRPEESGKSAVPLATFEETTVGRVVQIKHLDVGAIAQMMPTVRHADH